MLALLSVLGLGLAVGRLARRMTAGPPLLLLLLVVSVVLAELMSWGPDGTSWNPLDLVRWLVPTAP
jgi:hypothetical protein